MRFTKFGIVVCYNVLKLLSKIWIRCSNLSHLSIKVLIVEFEDKLHWTGTPFKKYTGFPELPIFNKLL
jgi:hypothetical protein